jgi:hypothetical protein
MPWEPVSALTLSRVSYVATWFATGSFIAMPWGSVSALTLSRVSSVATLYATGSFIAVPWIATTCPLWTSVVSPPGCGWSVTEVWGWDANEVQLRGGWWYMNMK